MPTITHYSDIENAFDRPERIARLATALQTPSNAILVGSGDTLAPSALANEYQGHHTLPFFESVLPAADTFGNHDFDFGVEALEDVIEQSPQPWISANVSLPNLEVPSSVVVERDQTSVGITGVTAPEAIGDGKRGVEVTDAIQAANRAIDSLRTECEYTILLAHLDDATTTTLAEATNADVVCGGHVHRERIDRFGDTCIGRPPANGRVVHAIDVETLDVTRRNVPELTLTEDVLERVRRLREGTGLDEVVTTVESPIPRNLEDRYDGTSAVADFVAVATRWAVGADVGVIDTGGVRDGPPLAGDVTVGEVRGLYPFDAPIMVLDVDGAELRALVDSAIRPGGDSGKPVRAYFDGLRIDWDQDGLREVRTPSGPLDTHERYTVATSGYVAGSGAFDGLSDSPADTGPLHSEALISYAREGGFGQVRSG